MNKETEIVNRTRLHLSAKFPGIVMWRNAIGYDERARVYYGLANPGGSDLIGMYRGRFVALEGKVPGAYTKPERLAEQKNFIRVIVEGGGIGGFFETPEQAEAVIQAAIIA